MSIYVVTGDSGMGITHGTIAGMLLGDLILGRTNPWASALRSFARPARRGADFARENSNVALQYTDWLTGATSPLPTRSRGSGAIVRRGLEKIAVYRDPQGSCTSATPPARTSAAWCTGTARRPPELPLPWLALRPLW